MIEETEKIYGATPQEWQELTQAGLTELLLPIVSNPGVTMSPKSALRDIGKSPSIKNFRGQAIGFLGWTGHETTAQEVEDWSRDPDYGIGVRTGWGIVGIDVDCDDPAKAAAVLDLLKKHFGAAVPVRFREESARFLVPLRIEGKVTKRQYLLSDGQHGPMVEILARGQQFKAVGMYKDGVHRYYWQGSIKDMPAVSVEAFEAFCADLVKELGAKRAGTGREAAAAKGETHLLPSDLADWLRASGLVVAEPEPGKLVIECPWADEHTDQSEVGRQAVFFQAGYRGINHDAFCCLHSHCQERDIVDFIEWAESQGFVRVSESDFKDVTQEAEERKAQMEARMEEEAAATGMPAQKCREVIECKPGKTYEIVDGCERVMAGSRVYYQRSLKLVKLVGGKGRMETVAVNDGDLYVDLTRWIQFMAYNSRKKAMEPVDPPMRAINSLVKRSGNGLPNLTAIARQPFIREDGSICQEEGYDAASGIYADFDAGLYRGRIGSTREEALAALGKLLGLIAEMEFAEDLDKAAAVAAMLGASVRPSLETAPMVLVVAHDIGSGKSFMTNLIAGFATQGKASAVSYSRESAEVEKRLFAALLTGTACIRFDNLTTDLYPVDALCSALTEPSIAARVLGLSRMETVSTRTLMLGSGNNVQPIGDMVRRTLKISLEPSRQDPILYRYRRERLTKEFAEHRTDYVAAALTIIAAWRAAGCPKPEGATDFAAYMEWQDCCRWPLIWLGMPDPMAKFIASMADDPDRDSLARAIEAVKAAFGSGEFDAKAVVSNYECWPEPKTMDVEQKELDAIHEREKGYREAVKETMCRDQRDVNSRNVGWWLAKNLGRIVNGERIVKAAKRHNRWFYKVASIPAA